MAEFTQDLRRNSVTWVLYDLMAFADKTKPTLAELNTTVPFLKLDITCALDEDSTTFTLGSSDMDERLSFCDGVGASRPTGLNPEASLGIFRDADRNANGILNKALNWLKHEDFSFFLVQRVGPQDSGPTTTTPAKPFTVADDIRIGQFTTDIAVDTLADGDPALLTPAPLPAGWLAWNIKPQA